MLRLETAFFCSQSLSERSSQLGSAYCIRCNVSTKLVQNKTSYVFSDWCISFLSAEEARERNLHGEIHELRNQLTRSVGAISEMETLRRAVEKSERQRAQLSDHLEVSADAPFICHMFSLSEKILFSHVLFAYERFSLFSLDYRKDFACFESCISWLCHYGHVGS